jgi:hypothetical protein
MEGNSSQVNKKILDNYPEFVENMLLTLLKIYRTEVSIARDRQMK